MRGWPKGGRLAVIDLMPEFSTTSAAAMRRVMHQPGEREPAAVIERLRGSGLILNLIDVHRDFLADVLADTGIEGARFAAVCREEFATLEAFLASVPHLRDAVQAAFGEPELRRRLEEVSRQERKAQDARAAFTAWLALVQPPGPDFWEKAAAAAAKGGPFVRVEKYEDLFGEDPRPS
jgi:hypothetical protein